MMDREASLTLLREQHTFPGPFTFRVVVRPDDKTTTLTAIAAAAGGPVEDVEERISRKGTYVALHVRVSLGAAESVLDVYDVLSSMPHVLAKM